MEKHGVSCSFMVILMGKHGVSCSFMVILMGKRWSYCNCWQNWLYTPWCTILSMNMGVSENGVSMKIYTMFIDLVDHDYHKWQFCLWTWACLNMGYTTGGKIYQMYIYIYTKYIQCKYGSIFRQIWDIFRQMATGIWLHCRSWNWQETIYPCFFNSETAKIDTFPGAIFVGLSMAMGVPQNRWFIMDYPTKMDDLKVPPFQETSKWKTINGTQMNITIKSFLLLDNQRLTMETCGNIEPIGNCGKKYQTFIRKYVWWVRF